MLDKCGPPPISIIKSLPLMLCDHNNGIWMLLSPIFLEFALKNCSWLLCSTETNNYAHFLYRVGDVVWRFLPLQRAKLSSFIVSETRERDGCLRKWSIAPPYCIAALIIKVIKNIYWHWLTDVQDGIIWRWSSYQDADTSLYIYHWLVHREFIVNCRNDHYPRY